MQFGFCGHSEVLVSETITSVAPVDAMICCFVKSNETGVFGAPYNVSGRHVAGSEGIEVAP